MYFLTTHHNSFVLHLILSFTHWGHPPPPPPPPLINNRDQLSRNVSHAFSKICFIPFIRGKAFHFPFRSPIGPCGPKIEVWHFVLYRPGHQTITFAKWLASAVTRSLYAIEGSRGGARYRLHCYVYC